MGKKRAGTGVSNFVRCDSAGERVVKRNLIYHVAPFDNAMLDLNLRMLARYQDVFNHKRVIHVAQGDGLLSVADFCARARRHGLDLDLMDLRTSPNDPVLCETPAFRNILLPAVSSLEEDEITFYGHAKGVTRPQQVECAKWTEFLYRYNLSDMAGVEKVLRKYACAGIFKVSRPIAPVRVAWHYSGTFFWFKNSKLFSRDWQKIEMSRYGVESYPATQFASREACCLAYKLRYPYFDLYDPGVWSKIEKSPPGKLYRFPGEGFCSELFHQVRDRYYPLLRRVARTVGGERGA